MEYNKQIQNRVKRIEGQLRGILRMMEDNSECNDLVTQMSAVRTALDRTIGLVVSANLEQCLREDIKNGVDTKQSIKDAVDLIVKSS